MNRHVQFHGKVRRYNHNLSYRNFFSGEIGEMRPIWVEDGVPGDTFQYHPELRCYFSPLVFPVLTSMHARIDVFFVPNRLAWKPWESFITGGPDNSLSPAYPSIRNLYSGLSSAQKTAFNTWLGGELNDPSSVLCNLGHPCRFSGSYTVTKDPYDMIPYYDFRYIFDEYYRDEEKEPNAPTSYGGVKRDIEEILGDSTLFALFKTFPGSPNQVSLPKVAWAKDYFTSASLEQQRGGDIPLLSNPMWQIAGTGADPSASRSIYVAGAGSTDPAPGSSYIGIDNVNYELESVLTINGLRYLYSTANWLNNNVVGGTRYIEILRRRYKVVSSDARLQRPEMVGSIKLPVNIDVVTQTSSTVETDVDVQALGDRAGKASVIGAGKTLTYSCEEFGYFIGILHIAPKASYFQGIRRNLQREDKFDFWTPEFEHVPQREIRNNEIYCDDNTMAPEDGGIFGYTGQYNEYRFHNDEVHGDFTDSLLAWTMARKFSSLPSLGSSDFLRVDHAPQGNNRIFAVPDSEFDHIFGVVNNVVVAKREISNREPNF